MPGARTPPLPAPAVPDYEKIEDVMDTIICSAAILMVALAANLGTLTSVFG